MGAMVKTEEARIPFQGSGEAIFQGEQFDIVPCPRCKASVSLSTRQGGALLPL